MKEAGSRWQSNPLAAYILCCTPPRDVQAPYEQRGGFPFIYSTKIDITIQVHPLETPTCNPFQHPCSKRGNRNKVDLQAGSSAGRYCVCETAGRKRSYGLNLRRRHGRRIAWLSSDHPQADTQIKTV